MGQKGKNEDRVRGCLFFRAQLLSRYADQFGNVDFSEVLPTLQHSVQMAAGRLADKVEGHFALPL